MNDRRRGQRKEKRSSGQARVVPRAELSVRRECRYIVQSARRGEGKVVTLGALLFFSTVEGDAWVLDPEDGLALRLAERGKPLPCRIMETPTNFAVEWTARYALTDSVFVIQDGEGKVTAFPTYPAREIREGERRMDRRN